VEISPAVGISGERLVAALREAELYVGSARGAGGDVHQRLVTYQRWVNDEARRLGPLLRPGDLGRLITTPRYWALLAANPSEHAHVGWSIDLELDERTRDLAEVAARLRSALQRWQASRGLLVVADTNVYLHHEKQFDEMPWPSLVPARMEGVQLVIPSLVIDELDRRKRTARGTKVSDTNREEVRTRARVTLRRLDGLFTDVTWHVPLTPDRFPEAGPLSAALLLDGLQHVRLHDADSEIIDRARALQDFAGRPVYLVTFDTGMAFRAKAAGLDVVTLQEG